LNPTGSPVHGPCHPVRPPLPQVAPDGSVIAVVDSGEPVPRDRVTIVIGFFDQLRRATQ
jgi:hypothetical protein